MDVKTSFFLPEDDVTSVSFLFGGNPRHWRIKEDTDAMLRILAVSEYRSLRNLVLPLARLNVITGPSGSGKSSLYRSLRLLAEAATGRLVASLAREGGFTLPSGRSRTSFCGP